jgi:hypothetical protein
MYEVRILNPIKKMNNCSACEMPIATAPEQSGDGKYESTVVLIRKL